MGDPSSRRFERYVAIGDSSTEGLDDPDGSGSYRGWANRLAERIASAQGSLLYANLAVRGRLTRQIRDEQLESALEMRPDLVSLFCGTNDVVARRFDADELAIDEHEIQRTLIDGGATLLTFTLPDLTPVMPLARAVAPRVRELNAMLRAVSRSTGAILVDLAAYPVASDPRLWSEDRLHANATGHTRIAAALAHALGLPDTDDSWAAPLSSLPDASLWGRAIAELIWGRRYLLPWMWRHARGKSSGDGRGPKQPRLQPIAPPVQAAS
jgi:lysophospholipase L1-like esterase